MSNFCHKVLLGLGIELCFSKADSILMRSCEKTLLCFLVCCGRRSFSSFIDIYIYIVAYMLKYVSLSKEVSEVETFRFVTVTAEVNDRISFNLASKSTTLISVIYPIISIRNYQNETSE